MDKLKGVIEQYGRFKSLENHIARIEAYAESDFPLAIENCKSLLESISKEICEDRGGAYSNDDSPAKLMKTAFASIGVKASAIGPQIAVALENIGGRIGELRNEIGVTAHGKTMEELDSMKGRIDEITRSFLIQSVDTVACFLIQYFEWKYPRVLVTTQEALDYYQCSDFNEYWDNDYGDFEMGELMYTASEILFNTDPNAYESEYQKYKVEKDGEDN